MNTQRRTTRLRRPGSAGALRPGERTNVARGQPPASGLQPTAYSLQSGFTLIELLVVISIIALLLGIIVPSYFSIREKAKYTKAKVTVKNLETAFKAYLDHYRVWPASGAFGAAGAAKEIDATVVNILRGTPDTSADNQDSIAFYEFEATNSTGSFLDPFTTSTDPHVERAYLFQVDDNYDNKIDVGGGLYRTVIVWSVGTNRSEGFGDPTKAGNVKSWD